MSLLDSPFALRFHSDWIYSGQTSKDSVLILDHTFFGITLDYKLKIHQEIFDFLYQSQGSFTHSEVYSLPISIRNLYFNRLAKILQDKEDQIKKQNNRRRRSK